MPLALVLVNSFNADRTFTWPPQELHPALVERRGAQHRAPATRCWTSVEVALAGDRDRAGARHAGGAGAAAYPVLRAQRRLAADHPADRAARHRHRHRAQQRLPDDARASSLGLFTIVVAHATFCIVTVFNNVQARLQRLGSNFEQASMDLGAGPFTTFRLVTFPMLRSALLAGALLAFGLSFDEIVVTTFTAGPQVQTLPLWIFQNLFRPNQAPVVNVVAAVLVLLSAIPIYLAQRLSGSHAEGAHRRPLTGGPASAAQAVARTPPRPRRRPRRAARRRWRAAAGSGRRCPRCRR